MRITLEYSTVGRALRREECRRGIQFWRAVACLFLLISGTRIEGSVTSSDALHNWPQWRGPLANGMAPYANPPIQWSEKKNISWKVLLPGKGHSSPIIFGDQVFVVAAVPVGEAQKPVYDTAEGTHDSVPVTHRHQFTISALNRESGNVRWKNVLREEFPHEGGHETG